MKIKLSDLGAADISIDQAFLDHSIMSGEECSVYVDSEQLIYEVERRPLLYDISTPDYSDRTKKFRCWEEVCESIFFNWSELSSAEKNNRVRDIQKRWRSIRDSFMKAYRKWKNIPAGSSSTKGKRYVYFKQMMFMIPTIEKRLNSEKNTTVEPKQEIIPKVEENNEEEIEKSLETELNFEECEEEDLQTSTQPIYEPVIEITAAKAQKRPGTDLQEQTEMLKNLLKRQKEQPDEDDEDKMFLLSLLSSFKKMDEDVKLATRIEILQTVKRNLHAVYFPTNNGQRL